MNKVENLKSLVKQMNSKTEFVDKVADNYKLSYTYVQQNWFQSRWKVPTDKIDEIIMMAQNWLFNQNMNSRKILIDTNFNYEEKYLKERELTQTA